jgi:hypothetical protein
MAPRISQVVNLPQGLPLEAYQDQLLRQQAEQRGFQLEDMNAQVDQNYASAQKFLQQLPNFQDVAYQGPNADEIQGLYQQQMNDYEAATNPFAQGTSGNLAVQELMRQQQGAARRGLLGSSGAINQQTQLAQQANAIQAQARQVISNDRFNRRTNLGTALTGLAQYNQGSRYQSELQKALQGLSTYGDYYAKPKNELGQLRFAADQKSADQRLQGQSQQHNQIRQEEAARQANSFGFGDILNFGSKLLPLVL